MSLSFSFFSLQSHHIYVIQILKIELGYHVFVYSSTHHDETGQINRNINLFSKTPPVLYYQPRTISKETKSGTAAFQPL